MVRMSYPSSRRWVAKLWRRVWQVARLGIRARLTAPRKARWIWEWCMGLRKHSRGSRAGVWRAPGKSHYQAKSSGALGSFLRIPAGEVLHEATDPGEVGLLGSGRQVSSPVQSPGSFEDPFLQPSTRKNSLPCSLTGAVGIGHAKSWAGVPGASMGVRDSMPPSPPFLFSLGLGQALGGASRGGQRGCAGRSRGRWGRRTRAGPGTPQPAGRTRGHGSPRARGAEREGPAREEVRK